jgi:3-methyl-2-oxobutanoate hydroxymethyltransferase
VLVMQDMLGITKEFKPRFLRRYADLDSVVTDAVKRYITDVKAKDFPNKDEMY